MSRNRVWAVGITAILLLAAATQPSAFAQRGWGGGGRGWGGGGGWGGVYGGYSPGYGVSIGVGNGYRGYGYGGYPGYGYGYGGYPRYGYGGYGYGSNYNQPYYSQQYYSQPVYTQPADVVYSQPTNSVSNAPIFDGGEIVVFSAADTPNTVRYTLNGELYELRPGEVQRFTNDRTWTIEIANASGQSPLRYTLSTGRYKFKQMSNGIGLFQTQDLPGVSQQATVAPPVPAAN